MTDNTRNSPAKTCYCPTDGVIDLLSRKYAMQTLCAVGTLGPVRYGELETAFGDVSSSTLSTRLDELSAAGLLERTQYNEIPPRVDYHLSEDGQQLCELLTPVLEWAQSRETTINQAPGPGVRGRTSPRPSPWRHPWNRPSRPSRGPERQNPR